MKTLQTALLLVAMAACGGSAPKIAAPLPDLAALDEGLATSIREAHGALEADRMNGPGAPGLWIELGMVYESNELPALALECYRAALDRYDAAETLEQAQAWSRVAQAYHGAGDLDQAARAMARSIEFDATYAPSCWRLGTYLFDLGRFDEAHRAYTEATRLDPDHLGGWNGMARVLIQAGQPEEAIGTLRDILEGHPQDATARRLLRTALVHAGHGEEAARLAAPWRRKSALGRDPWHREFRKFRQNAPLMERASADLKSGNTGRAVEMLEEFVEDEPGDMNAMSYLAWGYFQLGQKAQAQATLERALAADPSCAAVLRVAARIQRTEGDARGALEIVDRILANDPNDTTTLREKGQLEELLGNPAAALGVYQHLLELDQGDAVVWRLRADCELALQRWEPAVESYRAATRLAPKDATHWIGLARALAEGGAWEQAQATLENMNKLDASGQALLDSIKERQL